MTYISGTALKHSGWKKTNFMWQKNGETLTYDGYQWKLSGGKVVEYMHELPA